MTVSALGAMLMNTKNAAVQRKKKNKTRERNRYFPALIYSTLPVIKRNYCCLIFVHLIRQFRKKQTHPF